MLGISSVKQAVKNGVSGRFANSQSASTARADYEMLIIGAGVAGIGMACYLQQSEPQDYLATRLLIVSV